MFVIVSAAAFFLAFFLLEKKTTTANAKVAGYQNTPGNPYRFYTQYVCKQIFFFHRFCFSFTFTNDFIFSSAQNQKLIFFFAKGFSILKCLKAASTSP